jgi:hypothetical protein
MKKTGRPESMAKEMESLDRDLATLDHASRLLQPFLEQARQVFEAEGLGNEVFAQILASVSLPLFAETFGPSSAAHFLQAASRAFAEIAEENQMHPFNPLPDDDDEEEEERVEEGEEGDATEGEAGLSEDGGEGEEGIGTEHSGFPESQGGGFWGGLGGSFGNSASGGSGGGWSSIGGPRTSGYSGPTYILQEDDGEDERTTRAVIEGAIYDLETADCLAAIQEPRTKRYQGEQLYAEGLFRTPEGGLFVVYSTEVDNYLRPVSNKEAIRWLRRQFAGSDLADLVNRLKPGQL